MKGHRLRYYTILFFGLGERCNVYVMKYACASLRSVVCLDRSAAPCNMTPRPLSSVRMNLRAAVWCVTDRCFFLSVAASQLRTVRKMNQKKKKTPSSSFLSDRAHSDARFISLTAMLFILCSSQSFILRGLSKSITWFIKQATPINWMADTTIKIAIKWIVSVK